MSHLRQRQNSRMKSLYKRGNRPRTNINLVSLMDIFTIMVFYLLVNSSEVEIFQSSHVTLPESVADKKPNPTLTIMVSTRDILVNGKPVVKVADVSSKDETIPSLGERLEEAKKHENYDHSKPFRGTVTVMGDKATQFVLLKKVMMTCTKAQYANIKLAVVQKEGQNG